MTKIVKRLIPLFITCFVIIAIGFVIHFLIAGFRGLPYFDVSSLQEQQEELKNCPEVFFPDLSGYKIDSAKYTVYQARGYTKKVEGYSICALDTTTDSGLKFKQLDLSCISIARDSDALAKEPLFFEANAQYFGVDVVEWGGNNLSEDPEMVELYSIPKDISAYSFYQKFYFNGCEYSIDARLYLNNGGDMDKDFSAEISQGKADLLRLMKSIIDQGEDDRLLTEEELLEYINNNPEKMHGATTEDLEDFDIDEFIREFYITEVTVDSTPLERAIWNYYERQEIRRRATFMAQEIVSVDSTDEEYEKFIKSFLSTIDYDLKETVKEGGLTGYVFDTTESEDDYSRLEWDVDLYFGQTKHLNEFESFYNEYYGYQSIKISHSSQSQYVYSYYQGFYYSKDKKYFLVPDHGNFPDIQNRNREVMEIITAFREN
jgi:hypothetical protein